jgi:hypothetical protein
MLAENLGRGNGAEEVLRVCRLAELSRLPGPEATLFFTWTSGTTSRQRKPDIVWITAPAMPRFAQETP